MWGSFEQKMTDVTNKAELRAEILKVYEEVKVDTEAIRKAIKVDWVQRLKKCVAAQGGHFEL